MSGTMRGVLLRGPHQLRLEEVPRPVPRADQVLVRVRYSACCASDFDLIDGTMPDQAKYPIILGHEMLARFLGATRTLDVSKASLADTLREANFEPDVVMECSGSPQAFAQAIKAVRPGGRIGVLGYYADQTAEIRPSDIMLRDLDVLGAVCPTGAWDAAVALIADGRVNTETIITHTFPLDQFAEAYETARGNREDAIKVMLEI